jgi:hypothetical protein
VELDTSDAELLETARTWLPPDWREGEAGERGITLRLSRDAAESYELERGGQVISSGDADEVFDDFDRAVRMHLAFNAPEHCFLHAGAVAHQGRGIVIPGASFTGKTTLVAALVRAGATYYSDEHAVLDREGRLHPYPKRLGLRLTEGRAVQTNQAVSELGGVSGDVPVPVALVAVPQYRPGAEWNPVELSAAETVLVLMQHTFRSVDRPEESLHTMLRAVSEVVGLTGERGDADATAADLLARVGTATA